MQKIIQPTSKKVDTRKLTMTALLAAISSVLMFFSFNVPFMPSFIKLDLSELPALIAAFALGPVSGMTVCLLKNLVNLFSTTTGGIGELSNFLLGCAFVLPAGLLYRKTNSRTGALVGSLLGAVLMAGVSMLTNYYIVYPIYTVILPLEAIMGMYQAINPRVETLWDALLWFNLPFTLLKGLISVAVTMLVYKKISPVIKGIS